ncbi:hypothetical protein [Lentzea albida]|uniref:hypothetical protein n=1 Tax=Lentzea albida TaxID=65499 RepID=UPI0011607E3B|nr:hypothetical protein [Lentzea albida]
MADRLSRYRDGQRDLVWHELAQLGDVRESGRTRGGRPRPPPIRSWSRWRDLAFPALAAHPLRAGAADVAGGRHRALRAPVRLSCLNWAFQNGGFPMAGDEDGAQDVTGRLAQDLLPL